jgi:DNA-binding response OmpR family regulator
MARLILLENESAGREELAEFLQENGHLVAVANDAASFDRLLSLTSHHIVIVDFDGADGADGHGVDLIRSLRRADCAIGIIVYTASNQFYLEALNAGADQYHIKPMRREELLGTVNSLSRRLGCDQVNTMWVIDEMHRVLVAPNGISMTLSARDYSVLCSLIEQQGQLVTRRRIVMALDEDYLSYDQRRLDTQIRRIRSKAEISFGRKLPLNTVHGMGYIFAAPAVIKKR